MVVANARAHLDRILDPLRLDAFFAEVAEKASVKVGDTPDGRRAGLLGPNPEAAILAGYERLGVKIGSHAENPTGPLPRGPAPRNAREFRARIDAYHARGYTVRLPDARALSPALEEFVRALEVVLTTAVDAEIFWSRGDANAPAHCDVHDVFAIQLRGTKRWQISDLGADLANDWPQIPDGVDRLARSSFVTMSPGDLLYVPRGLWHRVEGTGEPSIHVSIGFKPMTLRDAVIAALDHLSDLDRTFRQRLDVDLARAIHAGDIGEAPAAVRGALARLTVFCGQDALLSQAMRRRVARVIGAQPALPTASSAKPVTAASEVRVRPLALCCVTRNSTKASLAYPGGFVNVPVELEPTLDFMTRSGSFSVAEIPGPVTDEIRVALANKLVDCGVLEVVER